MTILPTHTCFDDALDWIAAEVKRDRKLCSRLILVHGVQIIPTGEDSGHRFAHAWVEDGNDCWDFGIVDGEKCAYSIGQAEYYECRQVQEVTRYTVLEAYHENRRTGNYGPWKPEYLALCGRPITVMGISTFNSPSSPTSSGPTTPSPIQSAPIHPQQ